MRVPQTFGRQHHNVHLTLCDVGEAARGYRVHAGRWRMSDGRTTADQRGSKPFLDGVYELLMHRASSQFRRPQLLRIRQAPLLRTRFL